MQTLRKAILRSLVFVTGEYNLYKRHVLQKNILPQKLDEKKLLKFLDHAKTNVLYYENPLNRYKK